MRSGEPAAPGLYLHIPFCARKCAYCDFDSAVYPSAMQPAYLDAVARELAARRSEVPGPFATVYVGGGSPSSLDDTAWAWLWDIVAEATASGGCLECTVEMNPSQTTAAKLARIQGLATRVSLGAQTFVPELRRALGREPSDPACIARAAQRIAGRFRLNLDLMHSLPGQSPAAAAADIDRAVALGAGHVSAYALTPAAETPLGAAVARGEIAMPDEDTQIAMLRGARERLAAHGLVQYEISNFARPGEECRHNLATWAGCEYLGIGAAACSYVGGERSRNEPDPARYIARIAAERAAVRERERLDARPRAGELAMLALRTCAGIDIAAFAARTGFDPHMLFADALRAHSAAGLLEIDAGRIRLTEAGRDLANCVMEDFLL
ncbi:MAG TPA: radical SAM family heme chaperone HemW [Planctomycetota bacterium]|jgi:oxygen-independent coproporphyrinogen-3 oxidase|nr:radical SAM family heme chaperone HemW [Planctomycetota bacterium]OQC19277.1 MAG: Oxygen-independent coproporphyrinogen-III oxidase 1 [Planctomycetes bacterium ADurb.Bin069]NMD37040.1 radical SAM family heme chaperone HemW [Planctomycetota bacterium]HNS00202.1 radical SAM family heme chaperone HemW [Planctomycetota bacterium]HNU26839.1 radical SAM family heme chaperone HemW [Planctomycetota bacterium]